jgi:hypothetical protein
MQCRYRQRIGGDGCDDKLIDCQPCNSQCCPVDCKLNEWGGWDSCSSSCGPGLKPRVRTINQTSSCYGLECGPLIQYDTCNTDYPCPIDCLYSDWGQWSLCDKPCRTDGKSGYSKRYRSILRYNQYGGKSCPSDSDRTQQKTCNDYDCSTDCVVNDWSSWSNCSVYCGDGYEKRTRTIKVKPYGPFAADCPILEETRVCSKPCPPHCIYGPPVDYPCPVTCAPYGQTYTFQRRRSVVSDSSSTTTTLGRTVDFCYGNVTEDVTCVLPPCPIDCVVSGWGQWSECSKDGVKRRTRTILQFPKYGGQICPECLVEKDTCPYVPPKDECELGEACESGAPIVYNSPPVKH